MRSASDGGRRHVLVGLDVHGRLVVAVANHVVDSILFTFTLCVKTLANVIVFDG